jgi:hypothetical protein
MCGPIVAIPRYFKDGDIAVCRNCTMSFTLHKKGDTFEAVEGKGMAGAAALMPHTEDEALVEFTASIPKARSSFWFGSFGRS